MSSIHRHKELYNDTAAGTGDWVRLDNRYEEYGGRVLQSEVTAADTLIIQVTSKDVKGLTAAQEAAMLAALDAADITVLATVTADGPYLLEGPWSYIRVVKTGTAGVGKVQGFI